MNKIKLVFLAGFPIIIYILLVMLAVDIKNAMPEDKPIPVETINDVQIIEVTARAFNEYGADANGVDYWHGYVIVSDKSEIPLYSNLDIDKYGPCQVMAKSDKLAKNEVLLWYQAPSDVENFGEQQAWVRVLGEGENYQ